MKGLDTVESLSVEVKDSKVANFNVLVTLFSTILLSSIVAGTKSRALLYTLGCQIDEYTRLFGTQET